MRARIYNGNMRDFAAWNNAMSRAVGRPWYPYDYARNGGSTGADSESNRATLPLDVWTSEDSFMITAHLPGVDPENVEITFEGDELKIRGQFPATEEDVEYIKRELYHGAFERTLNFNVAVNADAIEANFKHGLLTLVVPKAEEVRPKHIKVQTA